MSDHTELDEARRKTYLVAAIWNRGYTHGKRDERERIRQRIEGLPVEVSRRTVLEAVGGSDE